MFRKHWNIEINQHWSLDGNSAENLSITKRIALNLLKQDKSVKDGNIHKAQKSRLGPYLFKAISLL
ncbi:MAG: hypothetical protein DGJ47_001063 [Rickettsiaceae bacterium]